MMQDLITRCAVGRIGINQEWKEGKNRERKLPGLRQRLRGRASDNFNESRCFFFHGVWVFRP
jgi:hypothetical protein